VGVKRVYPTWIGVEFLSCLPFLSLSLLCTVGTISIMSTSDPGFLAALDEAKKGLAEGGVAIGACLVSKDGDILGQGHNMRVQKGSATLHV
jgi:hypothetical protein